MTDILLIILIVAVLALIIISLVKKPQSGDKNLVEITQNSLKVLGDSISQNQKTAYDFQVSKFNDMDKHITEKQGEMNKAQMSSSFNSGCSFIASCFAIRAASSTGGKIGKTFSIRLGKRTLIKRTTTGHAELIIGLGRSLRRIY